MSQPLDNKLREHMLPQNNLDDVPNPDSRFYELVPNWEELANDPTHDTYVWGGMQNSYTVIRDEKTGKLVEIKQTKGHPEPFEYLSDADIQKINDEAKKASNLGVDDQGNPIKISDIKQK